MPKLAIKGGKKVREKPFPNRRNLGEEEKALLNEVIDSGKLFRYGGEKVQEFEEEFAKFYGVKYVQASTSGTAAIHLALGAINPEPGDEFITSSITDMGTLVPIIAQNCIPIFAEVDPQTYNLDPEDVEAKITDKTRGLIVVHLLGNPADMDALLAIAKKYNLVVVEDCCQAYLAEYKGKWVGKIGDMGAFSLQQSKHMLTGDGGITVTDDDRLAERLRYFGDKGWPRGKEGVRGYLFFGFNYRMNELTGAVALAQLGKVRWVVEQRREAGDFLTQKIKDLNGITPPVVLEGCKHSYWLYALKVEEDILGVDAFKFAEALAAEGVPAGAGYIGKPIYLCGPVFMERRTYGNSGCPFSCPWARKGIEYKEDMLPVTERTLNQMVTIGWNEYYTKKDVEDIAQAIAKVVENIDEIKT